MKKFFAFAAIALMCVPAVVSCKKDNKPGDKANFLSFGSQEKTIVDADYIDNPNDYFLTINLDDEIAFEFELSKANKGKRIDLLQPDPLAPKAVTEAVDATYYSVLVYDTHDWSTRRELANGNPKSVLPALGEGSYMLIDGEGDDIVLDFELKGCNFSTPFEANGITIAGHYKGFKKYVAPPK